MTGEDLLCSWNKIQGPTRIWVQIRRHNLLILPFRVTGLFSVPYASSISPHRYASTMLLSIIQLGVAPCGRVGLWHVECWKSQIVHDHGTSDLPNSGLANGETHIGNTQGTASAISPPRPVTMALWNFGNHHMAFPSWSWQLSCGKSPLCSADPDSRVKSWSGGIARMRTLFSRVRAARDFVRSLRNSKRSYL